MINKQETTGWTVSINKEIKPIGDIKLFTSKKKCEEYIKEVYFGNAIRKMCDIKAVKIVIQQI